MEENKLEVEEPKCLNTWRNAINDYGNRFGIDKAPKILIVNVVDLCQYEDYLIKKFYPNGIIPVVGGVLRFKGVPLGIAQIEENTCLLEAS